MRDPDLAEKLQAGLGDQYMLERELPRGGMSRVFVATESALGRPVVVKVLSSEVAATLSADRFKREITLLARLQHPHIVPLLSAGQAGKYLYYTMPLIDGESLRARIDRERPMPVLMVARILEEVASALAYAHREGVIHRDMKPENVMFYHGRAVVLDFGIGKALTAASQRPVTGPQFVTTAGIKLGTPTYMAPEQAAGDPTLDHRADLYALGVVAYEMITGHPPFHGRTSQAVYAAHAKELPGPIGDRRADAPAPLVAIVMKCLEKDPAHRPQTGDEIARAATALGGESPTVTKTGVASLFAQSPPWLPWVIAAVSTAVAVALLIFGRTPR